MKDFLKEIYRILDEKKGEHIQIIDISKVSTIGDYFIIATGSNPSQIQAMSDAILEMAHKKGITPKNVEGYQASEWILIDFQDIIIHLFGREERSFYDLERIWSDGKVVEITDL